MGERLSDIELAERFVANSDKRKLSDDRISNESFFSISNRGLCVLDLKI